MNLVIFTPVRLFGEALGGALKGIADVEVRAICDAVDEVARTVLEVGPDLVLFDVTGDQALREIRGVVASSPDVPIIAIGLDEEASAVIACADAGVAAYVPRDVSIDDLDELMRMTLRGEASCHPKIVSCLMNELRRRKGFPEPATTEPLSRRETEVLHLVGRGLANKEVATALNLSVSTIKAHLHNIFVKLNVRGRSEAIACLRQRPWLAKPGPRSGNNASLSCERAV